MPLSLNQRFVFETDDLAYLIDVVRPVVHKSFGKYKRDDKVKLYIRTENPGHTFRDGSEYVRSERIVVPLGKQFAVCEPGSTYHAATFAKILNTFSEQDAAAKLAAEDFGKKTPPTRLFVCSAGVWFADAGENPRKPRGVDDMLSQIEGLLQQAAKDNKDAVKELDRDPYFDGSVGMGYRVEAHDFAFTTLHFSLTPVYYSK